MRVNKKLILFFATFTFVFNLHAQKKDIKNLVNARYYDELMKNGSVELIHEENQTDYVLLPENSYKSLVLSNRIPKVAKNNPFVFEGLFYVTKADLLKESNSNKKTIDITDVSVVFRAISKMQGMKYYSSSRKKETVLYEKAFTIDNPNSKTAIPDKTSGSADGMELYCLQDDTSFGVCRYRLNYHQSKDVLYATFTTTDSMGLGPITAIEAGNLRINALVIDCGDAFLLYLSTDASCKKIPGVRKQVKDSLTARMDAVHKWFLKQF